MAFAVDSASTSNTVNSSVARHRAHCVPSWCSHQYYAGSSAECARRAVRHSPSPDKCVAVNKCICRSSARLTNSAESNAGKWVRDSSIPTLISPILDLNPLERARTELKLAPGFLVRSAPKPRRVVDRIGA
jgi:hypothetical protein